MNKLVLYFVWNSSKLRVALICMQAITIKTEKAVPYNDCREYLFYLIFIFQVFKYYECISEIRKVDLLEIMLEAENLRSYIKAY